uniref:interactor of HORMAD1 protein 1 isoform X1 n=2 Tax=Oncorhynchus gorbuscha TaxID=8017 RepID=UPI001EAEC925|nr:interactor of HORMAD1 protein 1 isoform X1 [Oncorhynchus gorbuscha]XP_046168946.1 interactor of HORMAD1 protein 1 isoform X1 [Oncorhynchus gorbuscha]
MNPNVWNIKEILSIPTGSIVPKITSRNGATSDYSSLTDSQFLFGSQFWPENSQGMSQDMGFSNRISGSSQSQEASEPKILSNYHSKPFLFGDGKDKVKVPSFTSGKAIGILDRFEEDKKKAKEKCESDILTSGFLQFREKLENIKLSVNHIDESTTTGNKDFADFAKTLQQNIASLQDGFAQQFEALLNKVSSQNQMLKEMENRVAKTGVATTELSSHMQGLQQKLEVLRHEQSRDQSMLGEALSLLSTLISQHGSEPLPTPVRVTESTVQTSPGLVERFCLVSEEKRYFEGVRLCGATAVTAPSKAVASCGVGETGGEVAGWLHPADRGARGGPSETCDQGQAAAPRALYLPAMVEEDQLERCSQMMLDEPAKTSWQGVYPYTTRSTAVTHGPGRGAEALHYPMQGLQDPSTSGGAPSLQYPMQGFQDTSRAYALLQDVTIRSTRTIMNPHCDPEQSSQPDHSEPAAVPSESPRGRSTMAGRRFTQRGQGQRKQPFRSRRRALMPPQTRSNGRLVGRGRDENRQPLKNQRKQGAGSTSKEQHDPNRMEMDTLIPEAQKRQQDKEKKSNKATGGYRNPFSLWSQESNSSVCGSTGNNARPAWEKTPSPPEPQAVSERNRGLWQLFDMNCDSD